jgi:hypothetical protein
LNEVVFVGPKFGQREENGRFVVERGIGVEYWRCLTKMSSKKRGRLLESSRGKVIQG